MATERAATLSSDSGDLDAVWLLPESPVAMVVFAHGAGAGYRHATMQSIAEAFAVEQLASLRFNFPFIQQGRRRVDAKAVSIAVIRRAVGLAESSFSDLPIYAGGHSFGGRMASHAVAEGGLRCQGLIFCSFPLHPSKKPAVERAAHLPEITKPMLFLSGTRDDLADRTLLEKTIAGLNSQTYLHWLDTSNHSYKVLKRSRTVNVDIFTEIAQHTRQFVDKTL